MLIYTVDNDEATEGILGGKAFNLAGLSRNGFTVPKWFAVTAGAFSKFVLDAAATTEQGELKTFIHDMVFPDELKNAITETLEGLGLNGKYLAVRSSAVGEDSAEYSFAGQLSSYLYVTAGNLVDSIKKVWLSAFSDRVTAYRRSIGQDLPVMKLGVIIQEMIDSEISGVAFALDPVTGNRDAVTISAVYGLGEGLVSGELNSDNYIVTGTDISRVISVKEEAVVMDPAKKEGTLTVPVPKEKQKIPALSDLLVTKIAAETNRISLYFGKPQDIEWAIIKNNFYLLQSRPVTTLNKIADKTAEKIIWDNSNIVESYPGISSPLTFSFINDVYTEVYKQFCRIMGVEEIIIEKNAHIYNMLGYIDGRVFYNLLNWYKVLVLLPGYSINAAFMEQMMGVKEKLEKKPEVVESTRNKYLRVLTLAFKLIKNLFVLPRDTRKFYRLLDNTLKPLEEANLEEFSPHRLMTLYYELEEKLLKKWEAPLVNDFYAMIFYGLLKNFVEKLNIYAGGTLQNDLLTGGGDMISTEPIRRIRQMANMVCQDEELKKLFADNDDQTILESLHCCPGFKELFDRYIKTFGDRWVGELKLETVTPRYRPSLVISIIKSYARQGVFDFAAAKEREQEVRIASEAKVLKAIKYRFFKRFIFRKILKQARERVRNRENLRFERTRLFALIREIFLSIGKIFYYEGIIDDSRDIFYLSKEEIFTFISGTSVSPGLSTVIRSRKEDLENYKTRSPSDRFDSFGMVYHGNSFQRVKEKTTGTDDDPNSMSGIGCCPGIVKAKVKIVKNPDNIDVEGLEGNIMVAERTDPGWVQLFPLAKGILVERGSLLSHSAIVAREMGIPAIVAIDNLLERVTDGETVEMNGSTGLIKPQRAKRNTEEDL